MINSLKNFELYYRTLSNERTNTMFETIEITILEKINILFYNEDKKNKIIELLNNSINFFKLNINSDYTKVKKILSHLFALYFLYNHFPNLLANKLSQLCEKYKVTLTNFLQFIEKHQNTINIINHYKSNELSNRLEKIRKNKKLHFYQNNGTIKLSTIHSFKGWETHTLFLIVNSSESNPSDTFEEILYTGITRSKSNLIIVNFGNNQYHNKLSSIVEKINNENN